jgi:hypothetical protein
MVQKMKLNQKDWSCPKKQTARLETIISQARNVFGHSIHPDKQYWTLAGQCATTEGKPLQGCEFNQLLESGLISANQFHGVEINEEIHDLNVKAFPKINWYNDDFYRAMVKAQSNKVFNPAIVNVDLPRTPDGGAAYISKIMSFLDDTCEEVLVVANVILRMRYYTAKNGDYVIDLLNKHPQFRYAMKGNWTLLDKYYEYNGAGNTGSRIWMGSFIFVKLYGLII